MTFLHVLHFYKVKPVLPKNDFWSFGCPILTSELMKSNFTIQKSPSGKSGDEFYSRIVNFHQIPGAWKCIFKVQRTSVPAYDHFLSFQITSNQMTHISHKLWWKLSQNSKRKKRYILAKLWANFGLYMHFLPKTTGWIYDS